MSVRLDGTQSGNCPDINQCGAGSIPGSHRGNDGMPQLCCQSVLRDDMSPRGKAATDIGIFLAN